MSEPTRKFLKSTRNGRVFEYTDALFKRGDMVLCDSSGNVYQGQINANGDSVEIARKAKYLGIPENGRLLDWTEILAARPGVVPIDDPKEWYAIRGETPPPEAEPTDAGEPTGSEAPEPIGDEEELSPLVIATAEAVMADRVQIPDITGLGKRDAKNVLAEWALFHYGETLNRGQTLEDLLDVCHGLLDTARNQPMKATGTDG